MLNLRASLPYLRASLSYLRAREIEEEKSRKREQQNPQDLILMVDINPAKMFYENNGNKKVRREQKSLGRREKRRRTTTVGVEGRNAATPPRHHATTTGVEGRLMPMVEGVRGGTTRWWRWRDAGCKRKG